MFKLQPIPHRLCCTRLARAALVAALISVTAGTTALAQSVEEESLEPIISNDMPADGSGPQCEWACQEWQKICNIDPRGIYKCNRICARFGEVCDE